MTVLLNEPNRKIVQLTVEAAEALLPLCPFKTTCLWSDGKIATYKIEE